MWIMVIFDLPVLTKSERRAATRFRQFLLDQGFIMSQFSVYLRFCGGRDQADSYARRIERSLPRTGLVQILGFTDKQYENIISFDGRARQPRNKNPEQYVLF
jgi:CRISPR-associated protein Cas2